MNKHKAVIGLGFGDESKGVVTDYLCSTIDGSVAVARFSGGHQAGHTVEYKNIRHVFSNFGSGSLRGIPTIWSKFCTVDPIGICKELKVLRSKGVDPSLYIDPNCPITTPFDKMANTSCNTTVSHGSCGVGFGATIEREEKLYSLLAGDLLYPSVMIEKYKLIKKYYKIPDNTPKFTTMMQQLAETEYFDACEQLLKEPKIKIGYYPADTIIYEGSQGLMLDKNIGFFPHVTRSNTGTTNLRSLGVCPELYLVTRCYQTRHGNGPMTNENVAHNIIRDSKETNVSHQYQGDFRISLLDMDLIKYAISRDTGIKKFKLVITCLEHIEGKIALTHSNGIITEFENQEDYRTYMKNQTGAEEVFLFRNHKLAS